MNNTNSPYSTYTSNASPKLDMDITSEIKRQQAEEQLTKAPKILPHTADTSLVEVTSAMYQKLIEIRSIINKTSNEPKSNKQSIKQILSIIDEIGEKIIELYEPIDKLYL